MFLFGRIQIIALGLLMGAFFLSLILWRTFEMGRHSLAAQINQETLDVIQKGLKAKNDAQMREHERNPSASGMRPSDSWRRD